jgi:hypothetical protein
MRVLGRVLVATLASGGQSPSTIQIAASVDGEAFAYPHDPQIYASSLRIPGYQSVEPAEKREPKNNY